MKKIIYFLVMLPTFVLSQQTITSVQNGNASNPLTWSCTCFPTTNDNIIINHAIVMDVDWAVTASGSITVNSGGSLLQSGLRSLLVEGAGSEYLNYGNSAFNDIAYTNGASGTNTGNFSITRALYFAPGTTYTNSGSLTGMDSLMTEGTFSTTGTCFAGNILNTGTFTNGGHLAGDSVGNTGSFTSNGGFMYFNAFGNTGTFVMSGSGFMDVTQNWFNAGDFTLGAGLQIYAHSNFYNGDTLAGSASLHNNGIIEVGNDFYNGYNMDGSGSFCVANYSYNAGPITGTLDFCDNTGMDFDLNFGTIAGTVTFCQSGCFVGIEDVESIQISIYPNPSEGVFNLSNSESFSKISVHSLAGQIIEESILVGNSFDLSHLNSGIYLLKFSGKNISIVKRITIE